jgi:pimeloyl-ACP methyl ester carboxylesterase
MTDFIFVHGGLHDGWCWHLVRAELERRGHRTWAPDLPIDDPEAGASRYADVVCDAGEDAGRDVIVPSTAASIFYHDCPPEIVVEALEHLRPQASLPILETTPLEAWPDVPADYIACREDRLVPKKYAMAVVQDRPGTKIVEMDGGHSPFLARPDDLVRLLLQL